MTPHWMGQLTSLRAADGDDQHARALIGTLGKARSFLCLYRGMLATTAPYVAVMDADLRHDERILPEMLNRLKSESLDIVVGSRVVPAGSMGRFPRVLISRLGTRAARFLCNCQLSDAMSGFFIVRRSFFEPTVCRLEGTGFKLLVDLLASNDVPPRFAEVPYTFRERQRGASKFGIGAALAYLRFLWNRSFARARTTGKMSGYTDVLPQ